MKVTKFNLYLNLYVIPCYVVSVSLILFFRDEVMEATHWLWVLSILAILIVITPNAKLKLPIVKHQVPSGFHYFIYCCLWQLWGLGLLLSIVFSLCWLFDYSQSTQVNIIANLPSFDLSWGLFPWILVSMLMPAFVLYGKNTNYLEYQTVLTNFFSKKVNALVPRMLINRYMVYSNTLASLILIAALTIAVAKSFSVILGMPLHPNFYLPVAILLPMTLAIPLSKWWNKVLRELYHYHFKIGHYQILFMLIGAVLILACNYVGAHFLEPLVDPKLMASIKPLSMPSINYWRLLMLVWLCAWIPFAMTALAYFSGGRSIRSVIIYNVLAGFLIYGLYQLLCYFGFIHVMLYALITLSVLASVGYIALMCCYKDNRYYTHGVYPTTDKLKTKALPRFIRQDSLLIYYFAFAFYILSITLVAMVGFIFVIYALLIAFLCSLSLFIRLWQNKD